MSAGLSPAFCTAGRSVFCGPTAIAALIGKAPEVVEAKLIEQRTKRGPVKGMWWHEVAPLLAAFGWRIANEATPFRSKRTRAMQTFARWQLGRGDNPWLVLITGHFVAVAGHEFVDTRNRYPIPLAKAPYRRCRVQAFARLERIAA